MTKTRKLKLGAILSGIAAIASVLAILLATAVQTGAVVNDVETLKERACVLELDAKARDARLYTAIARLEGIQKGLEKVTERLERLGD